MESMYHPQCKVCAGDGLVSEVTGGQVRCSLCFPGRFISDSSKLAKFNHDDETGRFDEDEYDAWWRTVLAEMRRDPGFSHEENRRREVEREKSLEIEKQTAERLAGVFKQ